MKLLETREDGDRTREEYLVSEKETEDFIITKTLVKTKWHSTGEEYEHSHTSKQQKFLCVNGPFQGQKKTWSQASPHNYAQYNCGENAHRRKQFERCVLVKFPL